MKKLTLFLMLVSLGLFAVGCDKPADAPKPDTTATDADKPADGDAHGETPAEKPSEDDLKVTPPDGEVETGTPDIDKPAAQDSLDKEFNVEPATPETK